MVRPSALCDVEDVEVDVGAEDVGAGPGRDRVETAQFAVHIDHHRIVGEARRKFLPGAGVDRPQVAGDRRGQAQFLREIARSEASFTILSGSTVPNAV